MATGTPFKEKLRPFRYLQEWVSRSPIGAFVALAPTVFIADFLGVSKLLEWWPALRPVEPALGILLDLGFVLPVLIILFVLPNARNVRQREASERALSALRDELEVRVHERTTELEESNGRLREEEKARLDAHKALAFQASLLDAVEEAVAATDAEGRIVYWNRFAEGLYGWTAQEVNTRSLADVLAFRQPGGQPLDVLPQGDDGARWTGEIEGTRRDGSSFPAYLVCSRLPGKAQGCVCLSFDMTALKDAQESIRDSEEKYSSLVERSPTGIFIFQNGKLVFVNPQLAELLQYPRDELLQIEPRLLVHPADREKGQTIMGERAAGAPTREECEYRLVTKTGEVRWVAVSTTPIRFERAIATLGNVQDVTDRKHMETNLHKLSGRLLRIQEEERCRIARDLHDSIGQTLTGIKFMIEAALGGPCSAECQPGMGRLRSLVPTIQDAVEQVRRISTELRPSILDDLGLLPTIAWYFREFEKTHPRLTVEQELHVSESDVPGGLRVPIFRILQEATNNVAKHGHAHRLVVRFQAGGGRLRLRVQDDGVGFDPKASAGEAGNGGFGLGSMRERTELSGGAFALRSAPGAGTAIEAEWPLDPPVNL